jgi:hypothetical protein
VTDMKTELELGEVRTLEGEAYKLTNIVRLPGGQVLLEYFPVIDKTRYGNRRIDAQA